QFIFAPITTSRIRVFISGALDGYSRITEIEAYGTAYSGPLPPGVTISAPIAEATFTTPASLTLTATAVASTAAAVAQVEFFVNGASVGVDTTTPYSVPWTGSTVGSYVLTATVTDSALMTATSAPVSITLISPDTRINVALAASGATATASSIYSSAF